MGKIAMGRSIGDAYDLTFGRYFTVLGVVWLPVLAIAAGQYFFVLPILHRIPEAMQFALQHPHDGTGTAHFSGLNGVMQLFNLAILVIAVWMRVGVTKAALDLPRGPRFAYFFVGLDELRVLGAYVVSLAIIYAAMIALVIVVGIGALIGAALINGGAFGAADWKAMTPWLIGALIATIAVTLAALIYVQARLMFLLVPVTVAEGRFGLWRSWELSRGNFWRIAVVVLGTASPLVLAEFVLIFTVYVPVVVGVVTMLHQHPEMLHDPAVAPGRIFGGLFRTLAVAFPFAAAAGLVLAPLFCGLAYSPSAFAYRSLVEKEGDKITAP